MSDGQSEMARLYLGEMTSIPQVANKIGLPVSTVRNRLLSEGITLRSRADGVRLRGDVLGKHAIGVKRSFSQASRNGMSAARLRWSADNAVGTRINTRGYVEFTIGPNKGRSVHAVTVEEFIGKGIEPDEVVHHINEDKKHNDLDNLALMTLSDHTRLHRHLQSLTKKGMINGRIGQ
jgi:hypothetical protein